MTPPPDYAASLSTLPKLDPDDGAAIARAALSGGGAAASAIPIPTEGETRQQFHDRMKQAGYAGQALARLVDRFFEEAGGRIEDAIDAANAGVGAAVVAGAETMHEYPPAMDLHLSGGLGEHAPLRARLGGDGEPLEANLGGGKTPLAAELSAEATATLQGGAKPLEANLGGGKTPLAAELSAEATATLQGGKAPIAATLGGGKDPLALAATASLGGTKQPILLGPFSLHLGDFKLLHDVKFTLKWGDQIPILSLTIKGVNRADQTPN